MRKQMLTVVVAGWSAGLGFAVDPAAPVPQPANDVNRPLPAVVTGLAPTTMQVVPGSCTEPGCATPERGRLSFRRVWEWLSFQPGPRVLPAMTPTPYHYPARSYFPVRTDCGATVGGCNTASGAGCAVATAAPAPLPIAAPVHAASMAPNKPRLYSNGVGVATAAQPTLRSSNGTGTMVAQGRGIEYSTRPTISQESVMRLAEVPAPVSDPPLYRRVFSFFWPASSTPAPTMVTPTTYSVPLSQQAPPTRPRAVAAPPAVTPVQYLMPTPAAEPARQTAPTEARGVGPVDRSQVNYYGGYRMPRWRETWTPMPVQQQGDPR